MTTRISRHLLGLLPLVAAAVVGARAEVLSYTLGIDVNCPTGLGE